MVLSFAKPIEKSASCNATAGINDVISVKRLPELSAKIVGASQNAGAGWLSHCFASCPGPSKAFQDVLVRANYDIEKTIKLKSITRLHFSGGRRTSTKKR